jgi:hypothetical protein
VNRVERAVVLVVGIEGERDEAAGEAREEMQLVEQPRPLIPAVEIQIGRELLRRGIEDVERTGSVSFTNKRDVPGSGRITFARASDPGLLAPVGDPVIGSAAKSAMRMVSGAEACKRKTTSNGNKTLFPDHKIHRFAYAGSVKVARNPPNGEAPNCTDPRYNSARSATIASPRPEPGGSFIRANPAAGSLPPTAPAATRRRRRRRSLRRAHRPGPTQSPRASASTCTRCRAGLPSISSRSVAFDTDHVRCGYVDVVIAMPRSA